MGLKKHFYCQDTQMVNVLMMRRQSPEVAPGEGAGNQRPGELWWERKMGEKECSLPKDHRAAELWSHYSEIRLEKWKTRLHTNSAMDSTAVWKGAIVTVT